MDKVAIVNRPLGLKTSIIIRTENRKQLQVS